ncbi:MAG: PAS domain S-box protein [Anaerolineales bacterium]|nr:PAS domain S-box protein [Anaerolineales bacterium]
MNMYSAEQLSALNRMGQMITASLSLPVVLNHVIEEVPRLLDTEGVGVLLPVGVDELVFAVVSGEGAQGLQGLRIPLTAGVAGSVMRTGRPVKIGGREEQNKIYRAVEKDNNYHTQSLLAVPLLLRGEVIGVLEAVHRTLDAYDDNDLRILEAASVWIALAIHNARLYEKAKQEITERKKVEKALRESETRYRTLTELAPVGIFSTDHNGRFTYVNDQWSAIVGLSAKEAQGAGWTRNLLPDDNEQVLVEWQNCVAEKRPFYHEFRYQPAEGEIVWVLGQAVPHYNQDGNMQGYIGTLTNITEREAMRQAQKLISLGTLVGTIAHDFNNLLSAIFNHSEMALIMLPSGTQAVNHIQRTLETSKNASKLSQQLLAYAGMGNFDVEQIDLNTLIQDSMYLLEVAAPKSIQLEAKLHPEPLLLKASNTKLQQVLMNLVLNAADALQGGPGHIIIETGKGTITAVQAHAPQMLEPIPPGNYITLEVEDNGCGITPETLTKIFDPFFTTKAVGHGLGLASVLGIIRELEGGIQIESQVDKGTKFTILFPTEKAAQEEAKIGDNILLTTTENNR